MIRDFEADRRLCEMRPILDPDGTWHVPFSLGGVDAEGGIANFAEAASEGWPAALLQLKLCEELIKTQEHTIALQDRMIERLQAVINRYAAAHRAWESMDTLAKGQPWAETQAELEAAERTLVDAASRPEGGASNG